jgi:hypothetical protein
MSLPDTPLFVKTHDFIVWLVRHTQRFAKNLRHSYTNRLESLAFDFEQSLLAANVCRGPDRARWLEVADGQLLGLAPPQFMAQSKLRHMPQAAH